MNRLVSATIFISIALAIFPGNVKAQLIPDNTLGNENSRVVPVNPTRDNISGGAARGANLFHSFQQFNIDAGRAVYFENTAGIENILTRITGANASNIFGTLGVEGNANLFLINPNGIIFGDGARLDVNGAFVASTASEIKLGNNGNFSATNPNNNNLLSIRPSALFFNALAAHQNQIRVAGTLRVDREKTIGLLGGNITVDRGTISASSGQIFLGAVNSGTVNLDLNNNRIDYSGVNSFGNIAVINRADILANTGGNLDGKGIDIAAEQLTVTGASEIAVDNFGTGKGGEINIRSNSILISDNNTQIEADVQGSATGNGGTININTNTLKVTNNAEIRAETFRSGNGGTINIKANAIEVSNSADLEVDVRSGARGSGGNININTDTLRVFDAGNITASTDGSGNGGTIDITANTVTVTDTDSDIAATVRSQATGNGGIININTGTLQVINGAEINANNRGAGDGGNINITATNIVEVSGELRDANGDLLAESQIQADVLEGATGNGGNIDINTNTLKVSDGAEIKTETEAIAAPGEGNAGNITIAAKKIEVSNSADIEADVQRGATGNGGNININTNTLSVLAAGDIRATTNGSGNGGTIDITANTVTVTDRNTDIAATVQRRATGNGGNININTDTLQVINGAEINANNRGAGDGGNINITATNIVEVSGELRDANGNLAESQIQADVLEGATGNGGNIDINTNILKVSDGAEIKTQTFAIAAFGEGNAGNITIAAKKIEVSNSADIEADVETGATGNGGNININTNTLSVLTAGDIRATTNGSGNGGTIDITANTVTVTDTNSDITAGVRSQGTGNGGQIDIKTNTLKVSDRAEITTDTSGQGNAGNITIAAKKIVVTNPGSLITTNTNENATGNGGNIIIHSDRLSITDGGAIEANILGAGVAARDSILIKSNFASLDNGIISAFTETASNAGNINLDIGTLLTLRNGSIISTESRSTQLEAGSGGNININSPFIIAFPANNQIVTRAISGDGGDINISAVAIFGFPQFLNIDASSQLQIDGNINIDTLDTSPDSILRSLESSPIDVAAIVTKDLCRLQDGKIARGSSFIISGKGGLSPTPSTPLNAYDDLLNWTEITSDDRNSTFTNQKVKPIVVNNSEVSPEEVSFIEARGWIKRADGKIVLIANPIPGTLPSSNLVPPSCSQ